MGTLFFQLLGQSLSSNEGRERRLQTSWKIGPCSIGLLFANYASDPRLVSSALNNDTVEYPLTARCDVLQMVFHTEVPWPFLSRLIGGRKRRGHPG